MNIFYVGALARALFLSSLFSLPLLKRQEKPWVALSQNGTPFSSLSEALPDPPPRSPSPAGIYTGYIRDAKIVIFVYLFGDDDEEEEDEDDDDDDDDE